MTPQPRLLLVSLLLLASAILSACSTSDAAPEESSTGGLTQAQFAEEYCAMATPCCEGNGLPVTGCTAAVRAFLPLAFDGAAGRACLESVRASASGRKFCRDSTLRLHGRGCTALSSERGDVPLGGTCSKVLKGRDCASSVEGPVGCLGSIDAPTCVLQLLGSEGAGPCFGSTEGSAYESEPTPPRVFYCDSSKGLHCDSSGLSPGVCRKAVALGAPCNPFSEDSCEAGAFCEDRICVPRATLGTPCTQGFNSAMACPVGSYCDDETCTALLADGAACTEGGPRCAQDCLKGGTCGAGFDTDTTDPWVTRICTP